VRNCSPGRLRYDDHNEHRVSPRRLSAHLCTDRHSVRGGPNTLVRSGSCLRPDVQVVAFQCSTTTNVACARRPPLQHPAPAVKRCRRCNALDVLSLTEDVLHLRIVDEETDNIREVFAKDRVEGDGEHIRERAREDDVGNC